MQHVLLTGLSGAGKSTVGAALAQALDRPFVDLDSVIAAGEGRSTADLVASDEQGFRVLEREAIRRLTQHPPSVVSLGGGALTSEEAWALAAPLGPVVWLVLSPDEAAARLSGHDDRPLLRSDPRGTLRWMARVRAPWYARSTRLVDAGASVSEVVARVRAAIDNPEAVVPVASHRGAYPVRVLGADVERFALEIFAWSLGRVIFIADQCVRERVEAVARAVHGRGGAVHVLYAPGGEQLKRLSCIESMALELERRGCDRDTLLVGVGGGSVTDAVGFLAAIYRRGVRWLSVPTTLLGMVDSSLGGKTGVNLGDKKNLLGAFYPPVAVVSDVSWLHTLDARDLRSGLAEMLKVAATHDAKLFSELTRLDLVGYRAPTAQVVTLIAKAAEIKARVVSEDEFEADLRKVLNFGHTFGHAFESVAGLSDLRHGEAVALGMVAETEFAMQKGASSEEVLAALAFALDTLGLAQNWRRFANGAKIYLAADKKRAGASMRMPVVPRLGEFQWLDAQVADLERFLDAEGAAR